MYKTIEELRNAGYILHHYASDRGYLSRKQPSIIEPYKGKFGEGYKVLSPRWDTTRYIGIAYYIKEV